jgi:hypothetical protein
MAILIVAVFPSRLSRHKQSRGQDMRHARAIVAVLFAMSSVSAMAGNELPNVSD